MTVALKMLCSERIAALDLHLQRSPSRVCLYHPSVLKLTFCFGGRWQRLLLSISRGRVVQWNQLARVSRASNTLSSVLSKKCDLQVHEHPGVV